MTRAHKLTLAASMIALAVTVALCWPKPRGYTYQGKTVEEWFEEFAHGRWYEEYPSTGEVGPVALVFTAMGTNAAPFLISRISRDLGPSRFERLAEKMPSRFQPMSKASEADAAAILLKDCVNLPPSMLAPLVILACTSTNYEQSRTAMFALQGREMQPLYTNVSLMTIVIEATRSNLQSWQELHLHPTPTSPLP
jgi:hypothetical protein